MKVGHKIKNRLPLLHIS